MRVTSKAKRVVNAEDSRRNSQQTELWFENFLLAFHMNNDSSSITEAIENATTPTEEETNDDHERRHHYMRFVRSLLSLQDMRSHMLQRPICQREKIGMDIACNGSAYLDLEIIDSDGGECSSSYGCNNVLRDDETVYCTTKSRNANMLLAHRVKHVNSQQAVSFVVTEISVKIPATGYSSPLKDGLIFISNDPIPIDSTLDFDGFTEEKYRMFMKSRLGKRWGKYGPAVYFKIDQKKPVYTRQLKIPRSGRYILIKLLNSHGKGDNIDLQYVGFKGYYGKRSFPAGDVH